MEKSIAICFGSVLMLSAAVALYYLLYMPCNQSTQIRDAVEHNVHFDEIIAADQGSKAKCMDHNIIPSISKSLSMLSVQAAHAIAVVGMAAATIVIFKRLTSYHDGLYQSNGQHESPLNDDLQSSAGVSVIAMEERCNQEQTSELVI